MLNTAAAAIQAKKDDEAITYYRKITDANVSGKDYLEVYEYLVDYYSKKDDQASLQPMLEKAKRFYPQSDFWTDVELQAIGKKGDKAALLAKYEELLAQNPANFILTYNYGIELYNSLYGKDNPPDQAITGSINDALRLGCSAIGFTIYPGSDASLDMFEEIRELAEEAKSCGLAVVIWSYARGALSKAGETAIDVIAYGAHMAALLGAHIIKVKLPSDHLENEEAKRQYIQHKIKIDTLEDRVRHVVKSCFNGRRLVIFSGGEAKDVKSVLEDARAIANGGGNGLIIGRNSFQRPQAEGLKMLAELTTIFKGQR